MTPLILDAMRSISFWFDGCFDLIRTAVLSTTVSIAFRPAAFIVSPDSKERVLAQHADLVGLRRSFIPTRSTIPSATPSAHAASTLPPIYLIFVLNLFPLGPSPLSIPFSVFDPSNSSKYFSVNPTKLVTTFFPTNSFASVILPFSGTCTCSLHFPNPRSRTSSTPVFFVPGDMASCSAT